MPVQRVANRVYRYIMEVEDKIGVKITILDITDELKKGFERWGFPSFFNRWCDIGNADNGNLAHHIMRRLSL